MVVLPPEAGGGDGMSEFVDCRTCKSDCVRADGNYGYTFCDKYTHPPMTNADRIRAMSDEELAWYLMLWRCEAVAKHNGVSSEYTDTQKNILNWLQKPTEEADK